MRDKMDGLIAVGKLSGQLELLLELREWLNKKIDAVKKDHETLTKEFEDEHDTRTTSIAPH